MSFIRGLQGKLLSEAPLAPKTITMEDIALCKGSSHFAVRALNTVYLGLTTGKWVTDEKVQHFLSDHMKHLDTISKEFKENATILPTSKTELPGNAKEIKNNQKVAINLSKVFEKAARDLSHTLNSNPLYVPAKEQTNLKAFEGTLHEGRVMAKGLKKLELNGKDPIVLLRAAKFEGDPTNDIKGHFIAFLKTYQGPLKDEKDLKEAFRAFSKEQAKDPKVLKGYANDESSTDYRLWDGLNKQGLTDPYKKPSKADKPINAATKAYNASKIAVGDLINEFKPVGYVGMVMGGGNKKSLESSDSDDFALRLNNIAKGKGVPINVSDGALTGADFSPAKAAIEFMLSQNFQLESPIDLTSQSVRAVLQKNVAEENLDFLIALDDLEKAPLDQQKGKLDAIMQQFVVNGSPQYVNLTAAVRDPLLIKWGAPVENDDIAPF